MAEVASRVAPGLGVGDTNRGGRIVHIFNAAAGKYVWAESAPETTGSSDIVDVTPAPLPTNLAQLQSSVNAANEPAGVAWQATVNTSGGYRLAQVIGGAWVYTDTGQESPVLDVVIRDVTPIPVPVDVTTLEGTVPAAGQPANEIWHATVGTPGAYQTAKIIGGVWDLTINDPAAADHNLQVVTKWENYINMDHATGNVLFDIQTNAGPFVILANPPTGISTVVVANNGTVDYSLRTGAVDNPSVVAGSPGSRDRDQDVEATTWTVLGGELIIGPGESRTLLVSRSTIPGLITIEPVTAPQAAVNPTVPPDPTAANQTAFPQLTTAELGGPMFRLDNGNLIGLREALAGWTAGASGRFVTAVNEPDVANLFDNDPNTSWNFASASWETLVIDYPSGNPEILRELHVARGRYDLTTNSIVSINVPTGFGAYTEQISATSPNPLFQAINNTTAAGPTAATSVGLVNGTGQREFVLELRAYVEDARDVSAAVTAGEVYEVTVPASNIDPSTDRIDHENPNTINGLYTATVVDGSGTLTLTPLAPQPGLATIDGTGFVTGDGLVRVPNEAALGTPAKGGVFGYAEDEDTLWISNAAGTAWDPAGGSAADNTITIAPTPGTDTANTVVIPKVHNGAPLSAVEFKVGDRRPDQTGRRATETVAAADLTGTVARTVAMGALYFYEFAVTDGANDLTVDTTEIHGASPNTFGAMFEAVAYYQAAGASTFDELTDTDTAGLADGDGFRWDAATSRLVPARIEVWLGDTADTASRLALTASPGDEVYQIDKKQIWKLLRLPSTSNANWLKSGERTNPTTADSTSATSDSTAFTADVSA